jgi:thioredoxin 1
MAMSAVQLVHANRSAIHARLAEGTWVVACLCAAWCDVCTEFRPSFERFAADHPDKLILWIDIEDEADVVGDFDVENFPTLLIEQGSHRTFFGTVEADAGMIGRLVAACTSRSATSARSAGSARAAQADISDGAASLQARLAAVIPT